MEKIENLDLFLSELEDLLKKEKNISSLISDKEKNLEELKDKIEKEKLRLDNQIEEVTSKRLKELKSTYENEHNILLKKVRKIKTDREKAKNKGVKNRVSEETEDIRLKNKEIKEKIKDEMKNKRVNPIVNTSLFRILYYPCSLGEVFCSALIFIFCFVLLPLIISHFIPFKLSDKIKLILSYSFCSIFLMFLYIIVLKGIKDKFISSIGVIKSYQKEIKLNNKQIKNITKHIKKDSNEEMYNLNDFDKNIIKLEEEIVDLLKRRDEDINHFEKITKNIIVEEIKTEGIKNIEKIELTENETKQILEEKEKEVKELRLKLASQYEIYLGTDLMSLDKISDLKEILKNEKVESFTKLKEVYSNIKSEV